VWVTKNEDLAETFWIICRLYGDHGDIAKSTKNQTFDAALVKEHNHRRSNTLPTRIRYAIARERCSTRPSSTRRCKIVCCDQLREKWCSGRPKGTWQQVIGCRGIHPRQHVSGLLLRRPRRITETSYLCQKGRNQL
jgi:hypothetical protein